MKRIWEWIKNNPNRAMFLVPILLVAAISISHVVTWYNIANPLNWAIYLSVAIEVGAMTALVAATNKIKGGVWFMFGIVTLIQMIGNIFFSYKEIDPNGELFKSWVELTGPMWELVGSDPTDIPSMKRWLAFLEGGLLPIISLTSLHFFVKYEKVDSPNEDIVDTKEIKETIDNTTTKMEEVVDDDIVSNYYDLQKDVWGRVNKLREEGKLPIPTQEDIEDEPSALAFTPYYVDPIEDEDDEDDMSLWDNTLNDGLDDEEKLITDMKSIGIELSEKDAEVFFNTLIKEEQSPNELLENALKKYKEQKNSPSVGVKNKRSDIKRID
jgi:hypothetical protein